MKYLLFSTIMFPITGILILLLIPFKEKKKTKQI